MSLDAAGVMNSGARPDGRGLEEFRPTFLRTGLLQHASGSSYLEMGDTKVMVGVFGPRQSDRKFGFQDTGRLQCDVRLTSFAGGSTGTNRLAQSPAERALATALLQALEPAVMLDKFPKTVVDVFATVLEGAGSELAACVTAASAALAAAGLELRDLSPACQVVRCNGVLLLDPTSQEVAQSDASLVLAQLPATNSVTLMSLTGGWSLPGSKQAIELAMGGCAQLREVMRATLVEQCEAAAAGEAG